MKKYDHRTLSIYRPIRISSGPNVKYENEACMTVNCHKNMNYEISPKHTSSEKLYLG